MTRRLEPLQWFALFGGAVAWTVQLVAGFGLGQVECSAAGMRWGFAAGGWQAGLTIAAALVAVLAGLVALLVVRETRETSYDGTPPAGRRRFFALASVAANALFLALILNTGVISLFHFPCHQS
jgi:hypothetical protein